MGAFAGSIVPNGTTSVFCALLCRELAKRVKRCSDDTCSCLRLRVAVHNPHQHNLMGGNLSLVTSHTDSLQLKTQKNESFALVFKIYKLLGQTGCNYFFLSCVSLFFGFHLLSFRKSA